MTLSNRPHHIQLSAPNSVLPPLVGVAKLLQDTLGKLLEDRLILALEHEIPRLITRILKLATAVAEPIAPGTEPDHEARLEQIRAVMDAVAEGSDYLCSVANLVGQQPGVPKTFKNLGAQIRQPAEPLFRVPLNKLKHDGFELQWLRSTPDGQKTIYGFSVTGLVAPKTFGPGNARPKTGLREGYSLPIFVRSAAEVFYVLCEVLEHAIEKVFAGELMGRPAPVVEPGPVATVERLIAYLKHMPYLGFPTEHGERVPEFALSNGSLFVDRRPAIRAKWNASLAAITTIRGGVTSYMLPYAARGAIESIAKLK